MGSPVRLACDAFSFRHSLRALLKGSCPSVESISCCGCEARCDAAAEPHSRLVIVDCAGRRTITLDWGRRDRKRAAQDTQRTVQESTFWARIQQGSLGECPGLCRGGLQHRTNGSSLPTTNKTHEGAVPGKTKGRDDGIDGTINATGGSVESMPGGRRCSLKHAAESQRQRGQTAYRLTSNLPAQISSKTGGNETIFSLAHP
jgi:hypothetical protein